MTKRRSSEFFGQECTNIFLDDSRILNFLYASNNLFGPGIQEPLHATVGPTYFMGQPHVCVNFNKNNQSITIERWCVTYDCTGAAAQQIIRYS